MPRNVGGGGEGVSVLLAVVLVLPILSGGVYGKGLTTPARTRVCVGDGVRRQGLARRAGVHRVLPSMSGIGRQMRVSRAARSSKTSEEGERRSVIEDDARQIQLLGDMVDYYRSNYETALRQIQILRKRVYQYELQLGLAPENTTSEPPKPSYTFPKPLSRGRDLGTYSWEQDMQEIRILIPVDVDVDKSKVDVNIRSDAQTLAVRVNGEDLNVGGDGILSHKVVRDAVYWIFAKHPSNPTKKLVQINLEKTQRYQNWEFCFLTEDIPPDTTITHKCYLDIQYEGEEKPHRMAIGLYGNVQPRTVLNFMSLCVGNVTTSSRQGETIEKVQLSLKDTIFHRIFPGILMQGGDIVNNNGSSSISAFGHPFSDEDLKVQHSKRGIVAMANDGPDSNGSQFYITFRELTHLNGKNVVFGEVLEGSDEFLKSVSRTCGTPTGQPCQELRIVDCGELP
ncbi:hypothetical protein AAMO2058_000229500 [Amorphochlora amoebiformis]